MKTIFLTFALFAVTLAAGAQTTPGHQAAAAAPAQTAERPFAGYFYNDEYEVYLRADFYGEGIVVPNHDLFGPLPGYFAKRFNSFYWLITAAKIKNSRTAELSIINDYGSEDLKATLTQKNDSVFILRQEDGSPLKVPNKGRWQKMPKQLELKKK